MLKTYYFLLSILASLSATANPLGNSARDIVGEIESHFNAVPAPDPPPAPYDIPNPTPTIPILT